MRKALLLAILALPGVLVDALLLSPFVFVMGPFQYHIPWRWVYVCSVPLATWLFWWIDSHTAESDLQGDATWATGLTTAGGHLALGVGMRGDMTSDSARDMPILTGLLLMGPRLMRQAINRFRTGSKFGSRARKRAELALRQLMAVDHSSNVEALLEKQEQMKDLAPALGYLVFYDWIGVSKEAERVWLNGETRTIIQPLLRNA